MKTVLSNECEPVSVLQQPQSFRLRIDPMAAYSMLHLQQNTARADSGLSLQVRYKRRKIVKADEVGGTCSTGIECAKVQLL
jgi:hypothetical protein